MDEDRPSPTGRPDNLGVFLREARLGKGLELSDVAERTHVRKDYLTALEEGRYEALPEDIYARNFVRLFAQEVGVSSERALELYTRERGRARAPASGAARPVARRRTASATPQGTEPGPAAERAEPKPEPEEALEPLAEPEASTRRVSTLLSSSPNPPRARRPLRVGTWLPTLILILAVGGLAVWAFNALLFNPRTNPGLERPAIIGDASEAATPEPTTDLAATGEELSHLTLVTTPPGAVVSVDGFPLPGTTPISGYPFSPSSGRNLRVTLEGYEPYEATIDLSQDVQLEAPLTPIAQTAASPPAPGETPAEAAPPESGVLPVTVRIEETTWLEAYASTQRGVGERLVYTTVQPGQSFTFPLPLYLHVGNAAGVHVWVNEEDRGLMGSGGEVVSRAFTQ